MKTTCAWCKKILKNDDNNDDLVSHGICPDCAEKLKKEAADMPRNRKDRKR